MDEENVDQNRVVDDIGECSSARFGTAATVAASLDSNVLARRLIVNFDGGDCTTAASYSDNTIHIYSGESLNSLMTLKGHKKHITGLKFSRSNPSHLYSSSEDGSLRIWDFRKGASVREIKEDCDADATAKALCSFDISHDERIACCGTELVISQAHLLFWDLRSSTKVLLGSYWESHSDDITHLQFKCDDSDTLASGSTDGLINVYDISQSTEEDALQCSLNTESSVDEFVWYLSGSASGVNNIASLTHDEIVQLWDVNSATSIKTFSREHISKLFQFTDTSPDVFSFLSSQGHTFGLISNCRRQDALLFNVCGDELVEYGLLYGKYSRSLCSAYWDLKEDLVLTSNDHGIICLWKKEMEPEADNVGRDKYVGKNRATKWTPAKKPY